MSSRPYLISSIEFDTTDPTLISWIRGYDSDEQVRDERGHELVQTSPGSIVISTDNLNPANGNSSVRIGGGYLRWTDQDLFAMGLEDFTIFMSARVTAFSGYNTILGILNAANSQALLMRFNGTTLETRLGTSSNQRNTSITGILTGGTWFTLRMVRENGVVSVYINDTKIIDGWVIAYNMTTTSSLYTGIGAASAGSYYWTNGQFQDFRVYRGKAIHP